MSLRFVLVCLGVIACGDGDAYHACEEPADCETPEDIEPVCLEKSSDAGFCTWACETDADCNEADDDDYDYVCAPFESTEGMHCFPSCEGGEEGDDDLCPEDLGCRSTGGGDENRKICAPDEV